MARTARLLEKLADTIAVARDDGEIELAEALERWSERDSSAPPTVLVLRLFGAQPAVSLRGPDLRERPVDFRLRRSLLALAFLAQQRHRQASKEELVAAIWEDASPEAVRRNFHPTLSELRRTLHEAVGALVPEPLAFHLGIYRLQPLLPLELDVDAFAGHLARGRRARQLGENPQALRELMAAWRLYQGPLLEDFEQGWVVRKREALRGDYLRVLREIAHLARDGAADPGEHPLLALDAFRRILIEEPYEENVHLEVMRLYARQGRRDLVRRQFIRLQEALKDLNVEPAGATQEEFHVLMR